MSMTRRPYLAKAMHIISNNIFSKNRCNLKDACSRTGIIYIAQDLFRRKGISINHPGKYQLRSDIIISRLKANSAAISINANNVTLDLNGFSILFDTQRPTIGVVGILVNSVSNVTIKNGYITDFSLIGVLIFNSKNINIEKINSINNGPPNGAALANGSISAGGLISLSSKDIKINNSTFNENAGFGVGFADTINIDFQNSKCDRNRTLAGFPTFGSSCVPFGFFVSSTVPFFNQADSSITIRNAKFEGNRGFDTIAVVFGVSLVEFGESPIASVRIEDVLIYDNAATATVSSSSFTLGLSIIAIGLSVKNVNVDRLFNNNPANSVEIQGIEVGGSGFEVVDCKSSNIFGTSSSQPITGFDSEFHVSNGVFRNCTAQNIVNNDPNKIAAGFIVNEKIGSPILDVQAVGIIIENCIAQGIKGTGFFLNALVSPKIIGNISQNNEIGFRAEDLTSGVVSVGGIIEDNNAIGNSIAGFQDFTTALHAYIHNVSRNPGGVNYQGLPVGTPIATWTIPGTIVPTPACNFDNLSILP